MAQKKNVSGKGKKPAGKKVEEKAPEITPKTNTDNQEMKPEETPKTPAAETPGIASSELQTPPPANVAKKPKAHLSMKEKAQKIFASHPKAEQLHFTSDETAFFDPQHARIHGESLEIKEVITIKREDI